MYYKYVIIILYMGDIFHYNEKCNLIFKIFPEESNFGITQKKSNDRKLYILVRTNIVGHNLKGKY